MGDGPDVHYADGRLGPGEVIWIVSGQVFSIPVARTSPPKTQRSDHLETHIGDGFGYLGDHRVPGCIRVPLIPGSSLLELGVEQ